MKLNWNLVAWDALQEAVYVMTHGLGKHGGVTWPSKSQDHHFESLMRHLISWKTGDKRDGETGRSHLAHALCRLMFMLAKELRDPSPDQ